MTSDERWRNINNWVYTTHLNSYIVDFFQTRFTQKKRDFLSEKRESGMTVKKREFTPKAVVLTPMYYIAFKFGLQHTQ